MHKAYTVKEVVKENSSAVTIMLDGKIDYKPGQFIMLWLPKAGEKPFAISYSDNNSFGVTVEKKGKFTKKIVEIKKGTKVGVRGPFGNGFEVKDNSIIVVGGLGMAPALSLIKKIKNSTIIYGAKSKEFLLYLEDKNLLDVIEKNKNKIIYCTDDGSFGIHGFTTEVLKDILGKGKIIHTCGPEVMIKKVFFLF